MSSRLHLPRHASSRWELLSPPLVSFLLVLLCQFAIAAVPRLFPSFPLFAMLPIAGVAMVATLGTGRCCRRLLGISGSAPAFVLFSTLFLWGFYIFVIREAIPPLVDATVNIQCVLLMFGFYRILSSDPGVVTYGGSHVEGVGDCASSEAKMQTQDALQFKRVRYCQRCSANILGFDHHCPAFGNCVGRKNHRLFLALLIGFIINEASYVSCSTWFIRESLNKNTIKLKNHLLMDLAAGTLLFSLLQILWQVIFLFWHIYCICFNIKTDEWMNWKKYPEFQVAVLPHPGQPTSEVKFWNPYDKGVVGNISDFLRSK
ncbi:hypothetical protein Taro_003639 [Colocasia esculenta]|uniref:S-acyltransferase n=1 Tax=Colocasia esculenta TaxID=4460 RepID=A0A843TPB5_COLES|nr:hypothetical protein [Colocasia esculenta]